jgi:peptide-methionine (S)-S-oxide reductase
MKMLILIFLLVFVTLNSCNADKSQPKTEAKGGDMSNKNFDSVTLGGGCFWCVEAVFQRLQGVAKVVSGYSGGKIENPTYKQITTGTTGYAEVVRVFYKPEIITFEELLEVFWMTHDPTTLNRQGADVGTQYRSVIFYHNDSQKKIAQRYKQQLNDDGTFDSPIVTEISPMTNFYEAEDYHQNYYNDNSHQPYCSFVITPKIQKLEKLFEQKLKD